MGAPTRPTSLSRAPVAALRPFVRLVWASRAIAGAPHGAAIESVLPTGAMHLVVRSGDVPLRLIERETVRELRGAVIGGARSAAYRKDVSIAVDSVGAMIEPGACAVLLGLPGIEASETHLALADVWGAAEERRLRERLDACRSLEAKLELFEAQLLARVGLERSAHPMVFQSVRELTAAPGTTIGDLVARSGYSHRVFVQRFREATGLGPKTYARVVRFQRAVSALSRSIGGDDARLALDLGFADQAHFCREFREISGLRPAEYRALGPASPNHVPMVPPASAREGQFPSIRGRSGAASSTRHEPSTLPEERRPR